jgi:outer membrane immunogenic protein
MWTCRGGSSAAPPASTGRPAKWYSAPGFAGATQTNLGWTIGAGIEAAIVGNWSAKAEFLHVDLGNFNCALACGPVTPDNVSLQENLVRGGVNYKF